jgi:hypothetical protein
MVKLGTTGLAALAASSVEAAALGAYNVDPKSVSTSGLSAGGFFAAQLGVAHSNLYQTGFGVFAGGPFDCARSQSVSSFLLYVQFARPNTLSATESVILICAVLNMHEQPEPINHRSNQQHEIMER